MNFFSELLNTVSSFFRPWFILAPWEQALRVRLGKHVQKFEGGAHLLIPFIDKLYVQSVRMRVFAVPCQTVTTLDNKSITMSGSLSYSIRDIHKLYETIHQPEDSFNQHVMGLVSDYVATHSLSECAPALLCRHINETLSLERYGISRVKFFITDFAVVRTYRLIQGDIDHYTSHNLSTNNATQIGDSNVPTPA